MHDPESVRQFEKLYKEYFRQIYGYIYRRVPTLQDTEDIVAETFTAVWANLDQLDPQRKAKSWVFGIASHKLNDFLRRVYNLEVTAFNPETPDPEDNVRKSDKASRLLDELLTELPAADYKLIDLHYRQNIPYSGVAEQLGISEDNAKVRAGRIITKLKKLWTEKAQRN